MRSDEPEHLPKKTFGINTMVARHWLADLEIKGIKRLFVMLLVQIAVSLYLHTARLGNEYYPTTDARTIPSRCSA